MVKGGVSEGGYQSRDYRMTGSHLYAYHSIPGSWKRLLGLAEQSQSSQEESQLINSGVVEWGKRDESAAKETKEFFTLKVVFFSSTS